LAVDDANATNCTGVEIIIGNGFSVVVRGTGIVLRAADLL
jgi:hypothetical protein